MSHSYAVAPELGRDFGRRLPPGFAGHFLHVAPPLVDRSVHHRESRAQGRARRDHQRLVGVAFGSAQMVVDVQRMQVGGPDSAQQGPGQKVQQG